MVLKSIKKVGTRRGRSIVVRDDIDKTTSGRQVRQGIGKLMKLQAKDYQDPDGGSPSRRWRLQHVREHVRVFVEEERDRPRPGQLARDQGLRRGQLGRAGGSREESLPLP